MSLSTRGILVPAPAAQRACSRHSRTHPQLLQKKKNGLRKFNTRRKWSCQPNWCKISSRKCGERIQSPLYTNPCALYIPRGERTGLELDSVVHVITGIASESSSKYSITSSAWSHFYRRRKKIAATFYHLPNMHNCDMCTVISNFMCIKNGRRKVESALDIHLDVVAVEQVRVIKYLGVLINNTLTWSDHVGLVCRKVNGCLNLLRRLSWFLPRSLLLTYLKSYILPHFDYCDVVWSSCTQEESRRLESLLNFGCKIVLCKRRDFSSTTALHELELTALTSRRRIHTVQCMLHCLASQAPSYLTWLFSSTTQHHNTLSSSTHQLNLPPVKSSFGQRAFGFAGPSLWHSLPLAIHKAKDYGHFSEQCRRFYSNAWMTECWTLFVNISLAFISMNFQTKLKSEFTFITLICLCFHCAGCLNSGLWLLVSQIN